VPDMEWLGTWIPNRDVALYMRQHVLLASGGDYLMTLTTCFLKDGRSVLAYVFHPVGTKATDMFRNFRWPGRSNS
jgi:hypothetical protein